jgi:glycosyltransferase involved in cell wall biosynthesis
MYRCLQANLLFSPIPEAPLFSQCRFVVTAHDFIPLRFPKRRSPLTPYFRYYVPEVIRQAQHVICNSEATARDVVQFAGVSAKHLTAIPLAYDANLFYSQDVPTDNYFLYVGRSDPHKNVHRLITAFAALPSSVDCELWIAGSSDRRYTPALQAQATELGVAHRVKWLDYITDEELVMLLNRAIALVFPSLWEGFGLPVLEAMACGTPVITSNLSSLPEVTGDAALLVDPYDSGAIAHAMQEVVTDNSVRSHLRQAGLRRAQAFSWEKTGQATVDVLTRYGAGVV